MYTLNVALKPIEENTAVTSQNLSAIFLSLQEEQSLKEICEREKLSLQVVYETEAASYRQQPYALSRQEEYLVTQNNSISSMAVVGFSKVAKYQQHQNILNSLAERWGQYMLQGCRQINTIAKLTKEKEKYEQALKSLQKEQQALQKSLSELMSAAPAAEGEEKQQAKQKTLSHQDGISGIELRSKVYHTLDLKGNLGKFLGEIDRHKVAIALLGDPGAGKSTFSVNIASLFERQGYSIIYYSLEQGISKPLQDAFEKYKIEKVRVVTEGDLEAVRQSAKKYDVVMVDSFGKLDCQAKEIHNLRISFPKTIFLFIHQKTSSGKSRGGSAVVYDSSMNIDVVKEEVAGKKVRVARMEKSRYGTQGWSYYIETDEVEYLNLV